MPFLHFFQFETCMQKGTWNAYLQITHEVEHSSGLEGFSTWLWLQPLCPRDNLSPDVWDHRSLSLSFLSVRAPLNNTLNSCVCLELHINGTVTAWIFLSYHSCWYCVSEVYSAWVWLRFLHYSMYEMTTGESSGLVLWGRAQPPFCPLRNTSNQRGSVFSGFSARFHGCWD